MNYHHFTIEERCCRKRKKLSGNRKAFGQKRQFGIERIEAELYLLQGYPEILSAYGAKEKQTAQQLPPPGNVLETGGIGVHRRKAVANMVARTDSQYAVRDEDAVVQDNIPLDRRKILAFHPEKPTEKRENP